jgi:xanthine/CO dehydrogenase XdhC/CoxF family maturation factor
MTARALIEGMASLAGEEHVVATVVDVIGSSYRRPGARMIVTRGRRVAGAISGGCLEGDVLRRGFWRTEHGPVVVTYDASEDGTGSGCNGVVDVLLERTPIGGIDPVAVLARCMREQRRATIVTRFRDGFARAELVDGRLAGMPELEDAARHARATTVVGGRAVIEVLVPPPRLFVLGGGIDAVPVVEQARAVGWEVIACTPYARSELRLRFQRADRLAIAQPAEIVREIDGSDRAAVLVMNHDYAHDRACLDAALRSTARYIGVLGPRARTQRMLDELGRTGDPRLHAPVRLELGAETAEEIALAIVAEVQAALARTPAQSLRTRIGPIHDEAIA